MFRRLSYVILQYFLTPPFVDLLSIEEFCVFDK